jgi:hypothetical protein
MTIEMALIIITACHLAFVIQNAVNILNSNERGQKALSVQKASYELQRSAISLDERINDHLERVQELNKRSAVIREREKELNLREVKIAEVLDISKKLGIVKPVSKKNKVVKK